MIHYSFKKRMSVWLAALMIVSSIQLYVPPKAANAAVQEFPISLQLNNMDSATNSTGDTVGTAGVAVEANANADYIKEGAGSKKWILAFNNDPQNPASYIAGAALIYPKLSPNVDLNGYSTLKVWAYSVKARSGDQADKPIQIRFFMKGDSEYYYYRIPLDWTGWKEIEVPLSVAKTQKSSENVKAWGPLDYVRFDQAGVGGTTLDPELNIYLDDLRLTNMAEVHPVTTDKPSGEYINKVTVSLSSESKPSVLAKLYYKREGVDADFQLYTTPLTLTADTTLVVKASLNGVDSEVTTYAYTFVYRDFVENVIASPPAGTYAEMKTVTLTSATEGAAIYYKVEGIDADYKAYTAPLQIDHSQIVTAKAEFEGKVSEETSHAYHIDLSGSGSLPLGDSETFGGWTNTTATTAISAVRGQKSGLWTDPTTAINVSGFTAQWNDYDQIEFWLYSERASNKKVYFIIQTPDNNVPGNEYFMTSFFVDWTGWKKVELPFNKFLNSNGSADFANFTQIVIHPHWYDSDPAPDPTDKLYFDGMALAKNAIEPSIKQIDKSALPDSTLHYSFSLKNIGDVDTAYAIMPKTEFGEGYDVAFSATTPIVAKGEETNVDIQVKVPAAARAGEAKKGVFTIKPVQGGKETSIELNVKVGAPRIESKQHPYVMVSQSQLDDAKSKIENYAWAKAYLDAIKVKADVWINKTVYYPSQPAGESSLYVCGDTPLVFDYDKPHEHLCPTDNTWHTGEDLDAAWRFTTNTVNIEAARNLAIVYALTGDTQYALKAKEILLNYAALYPSYPLQALNGRLYYQSLDEAVQMIELVHAYDLIEPSGLLTDAEKYDVEQNLFAPSAKTLQGYDVGKSNWQTWHNAAIGTIGAVLEDRTLMDFSVLGRSGFNFQMNNSVLSDGFWYEGAIGYHFYAQSALLYHAQALKNMGYDLFANPNLKKTFDVTLQYAFPDLGIINSNDSGKYPTNLGAPGKVVPMDYEGVYAQYSDPVYGALLSKLYNDKQRPRGGFVVPGNTNSGIAGEQAVFYGKSVIPSGGELPSSSTNFTGLGHSVLRAGTGNDQLYALVDYGLHGGYHGHPDKLHLEIFGKGERLAPDLGIPPYSSSMYESYYKKTFAHNTVTVDGDIQSIPSVNNVEVYDPTKLMLQSEPFKIMTNTSGKAYPGLDRYERTVAVTKDYLVDLFSVESATSRQYDWIMHGMGEFTAGPPMDTYSGALGTKDAYSFFRNGKTAKLNGAWEGAWKTANGNGLKLFSLTSSSGVESEMIVGEAPGPGNDTNAYAPTVVNRINGSNAQFVSVLEPYQGTSQILSVRKTDSSQVEVKLKDGRMQIFYYNSGIEAVGQLQYYFVDGKNYKAEEVEIATSLVGGELSITAGSLSGMSSSTVIVYAPSTTRAVWNGKEVPFTDDNGFVMVNLSSTPDSGPGVPGTPDPEPGVPGTSDPEPGVPGTPDPEPGVPGTSDPEPGVPGTPDPEPGVPGTSDPEPGVPGTPDPEPGVPGTSDPEPGVPGTPDPEPGVSGTPVPPANSSRIEKQVTAEASAELAFQDDIIVYVPARAMSQATKYAIEKLQDPVILKTLLKGNPDLLSPVFEITKDQAGLFAVPIKLRIKFDPSRLKAGHVPSVHYYDEASGRWIPMGGTVDGTYVEVESNHLTKFAVLAVVAPVTEQPELADIANHWAEADIRKALKSGIAHGYPDGTFKPNQFVTRAEFSVMLMNALQPNAEPAKLPDYRDIEKIGSWARQAIAAAAQANIVSGYADGSFRPGAQLTRAELSVMLANVLGESATASGKATFADVSAIPVWALNAAGKVQEAGLIVGRTGNRFDASAAVSRAEAITVIIRLQQVQNQLS